jgi:hypothetical protein
MVSTQKYCEDLTQKNRDTETLSNDSNAASSESIFDRELYRRLISRKFVLDLENRVSSCFVRRLQTVSMKRMLRGLL